MIKKTTFYAYMIMHCLGLCLSVAYRKAVLACPALAAGSGAEGPVKEAVGYYYSASQLPKISYADFEHVRYAK